MGGPVGDDHLVAGILGQVLEKGHQIAATTAPKLVGQLYIEIQL